MCADVVLVVVVVVVLLLVVAALRAVGKGQRHPGRIPDVICRNPFPAGVLKFGCGQCTPCRVNRRRLWVHRLLLESMKHGNSAFIGLSYDDRHLPADRSLNPRDLQLFLKRIRERVEPQRLRFFGIGEYGERTNRPHYHVILFGLQSCLRGRTEHRVARCCPQCDLVSKAWRKGSVDLGEVNKDSASYITGYVQKKLTKRDDARLGGRHPEFARMSNRPGIGAHAMLDVAAVLHGELVDDDVPTQLRHGGKLMPLGRYLRRKLREAYGLSELGTPKEVLAKVTEEMLVLQEERVALELSKGKKVDQAYRALIDERLQKCLNIEAKVSIWSKKGTL